MTQTFVESCVNFEVAHLSIPMVRRLSVPMVRRLSVPMVRRLSVTMVWRLAYLEIPTLKRCKLSVSTS